MAGNDDGSKTVCVMDASGQFGSTLVRRLLQRGYTVHAAVHNHGELQINEGEIIKNENLKVFQADPFDYHSIISAIKGCSGLFYSFEPPSDHPTYDEYMAEIEVRAAHNVLEACAQTETIQKVVFTSSITAVIWNNKNNDVTSSDLDERNWSDINFCKKFKLWHGASKTVAEKTAWGLAMDREVNMVSINGGLIITSDLTILNPYLKGAAEMYESGVFVTVDLGFIVDAHISIFQDISSFGRYLCFDHVISCNEDANKLIRILLPPSSSSNSPPQSMDDGIVYPQRISSKKLNKVMADFDRCLLID